MKLFLSILFTMISCVLFAQNGLKNDIKTEIYIQESKQIQEIKQPTFMVDDKIVDLKQAVKLNLDLIENIVIIKNDPKFPDGLVKITMKNN